MLVTGKERDLIDKLGKTGRRLDDPAVHATSLSASRPAPITSYHLKRLGPNRYEKKPPKGATRGRVVEIEDEMMKAVGLGGSRQPLSDATDGHASSVPLCRG